MKRHNLLFFGVPILIIGLLLAGSYLFQDNLSRFLLNPRTPFQASPQPQRPNYSQTHAWALWQKDTKVANDETPISAENIKQNPQKIDVFYIHGTIFSSNQLWNSPIDDRENLQKINQIAIPNEVGPFASYSNIYAPLYRQATLYSRFTHKFDGLAARQLAYEDIKAAFQHYLNTADPEVPLILLGYDQGGLYAMGLLKEFFTANPKLQNRLVSAYIIQTPISQDAFMEGLNACENKLSTNCIISYNHYEASFKREIQDIRTRALIWNDNMELTSIRKSNISCINPLTWLASRQKSQSASTQNAQQNTERKNTENQGNRQQKNGQYAPPSQHSGGASATGLTLNQPPPIMTQAVGAQCRDGVLIVDQPDKSFLRDRRWFGQQWQPKNYNLFYADLSQDAKRRITLHRPILASHIRNLDPIENSIDFTKSPIKKVPK